jgi:tetratricopeptide (TPR) repeat protein
MKFRSVIGAVALATTLSFGSASNASAQGPSAAEILAGQVEQAGRIDDAFRAYLQALHALESPPPIDADIRIRERVILLARRLPAPPPVPAEAERRAVRGNELYAQKDFKGAESEFRQAVRAAPWITDLPYNLALAQEHLHYYKAGAANLRLHLLGNPDNAADIRAKMYALELERTRAGAAAQVEDCAFGDRDACAAVQRSNAESAARVRQIEAQQRAASSRAAGRAYRRAAVTMSFMPSWNIPRESVFSEALLLKPSDEDDYAEFSMRGSALRIGIGRAFDNGNDETYVQDWSFSFVRMPVRSGSYDYRETSSLSGGLLRSSYVGFDDSSLNGAVLDFWLGPDPFAGRVELGVKVGVGFGVLIGDVKVEEYDARFGSTVETVPARQRVTTPVFIANVEPGVGIRVAPGVKVRFTYGLSLPVYTGAHVSVQYAFGAR